MTDSSTHHTSILKYRRKYCAALILVCGILFNSLFQKFHIDLAHKDDVAALLSSLHVQPHSVFQVPESLPEYSRDEFGQGWQTPFLAGNTALNTRKYILEHLSTPSDDSDLAISSMIFDEYNQRYISTDSVDIDHIVPLSAAWKMGAYSWEPKQREYFANDLEHNLLPTLPRTNRSKSDSTLGQWLPPSRKYWCTYAFKYLTVAYYYQLAIYPEDSAIARKVCSL